MFRWLLLPVTCIVLASPAMAGDVKIVIDISSQHMKVAVDGAPTYSFAVSTGRKGYRTPQGSYGVQRMYKSYHSKKYELAPMPYSIFFHGGYAIHGTNEVKRLGSPASHGCVRLAPGNARKLFNLVQQNGSENVSIRVKS